MQLRVLVPKVTDFFMVLVAIEDCDRGRMAFGGFGEHKDER